jgi:hypothetical protein
MPTPSCSSLPELRANDCLEKALLGLVAGVVGDGLKSGGTVGSR